MRIAHTYGKLNDPTVNTATKATKGRGADATPKSDAQAAGGADPSRGDAVTVSAQAQELAQKAATDADATKVATLRSAIESGSLKIDRQAIAQRIVDGG